MSLKNSAKQNEPSSSALDNNDFNSFEESRPGNVVFNYAPRLDEDSEDSEFKNSFDSFREENIRPGPAIIIDNHSYQSFDADHIRPGKAKIRKLLESELRNLMIAANPTFAIDRHRSLLNDELVQSD